MLCFVATATVLSVEGSVGVAFLGGGYTRQTGNLLASYVFPTLEPHGVELVRSENALNLFLLDLVFGSDTKERRLD